MLPYSCPEYGRAPGKRLIGCERCNKCTESEGVLPDSPGTSHTVRDNDCNNHVKWANCFQSIRALKCVYAQITCECHRIHSISFTWCYYYVTTLLYRLNISKCSPHSHARTMLETILSFIRVSVCVWDGYCCGCRCRNAKFHSIRATWFEYHNANNRTMHSKHTHTSFGIFGISQNTTLSPTRFHSIWHLKCHLARA